MYVITHPSLISVVTLTHICHDINDQNVLMYRHDLLQRLNRASDVHWTSFFSCEHGVDFMLNLNALFVSTVFFGLLVGLTSILHFVSVACVIITSAATTAVAD